MTTPTKPHPARHRLPHALVIVLAAAGTLLVPIGTALALRAFVIEAFQIPSGSMVPNLIPGDHLFVNKASTRPGRGDVVVFRFPAPAHR